jgi:hypothetical protein
MRRSWIAAAALLAVSGALTGMAGQAGAQTGVRPVRIGLAGPGLDACLSLAEVRGVDRENGNVLTVRATPRIGATPLDRLAPGRQVWVCDGDAMPGWTGIVYAEQPGQDCGVAAPVASPQSDRGPCREGWVASRYLAVIAG